MITFQFRKKTKHQVERQHFRNNILKISFSAIIILTCNKAFSNSYLYDNLNRLVRVEFTQNKAINFTYDAGGNLLSVNSEGVNTHAYNPETGEEDDFTNLADVPADWVIGKAPDYDGDGINDIVDTDDDNDTLPDDWEEQYGLDSKDNTDANTDLDGDGFSNFLEYQANSNPTDNTSTPNNPNELQTIVISGCDSVGIDQIANCQINYSTSDNNQNTSGLGLRIHFNVNKLDWVNVSNIVPSGFVNKDDQPVADSTDYDNDPLTTHYLTLTWNDSSTNWPSESLPVSLYEIGFQFKNEATLGDTTTLRFSASTIAAGYSFQSTPAVLTLANQCTLDIDNNGEAKPLTDGLLILRYMFNFRGTTLIDGIISPSATRTSATEVEAYLNQCQTILDIDDNGEVKPLTDGLLILRHMFNFRNEALIDGVVSPTGQRKTSTAIDEYIQSVLPK